MIDHGLPSGGAREPGRPQNSTNGIPMNTSSISSSGAAPARDFQVFDAGNVLLQSGRTFRNMTIAYKTFGALNADKSNVIVYPTSYGAQHHDIQFMVGAGAALDPQKYFIVIPNLFGNGLSSSPSNTVWPDVGSRYPNITCFDAVHVQRRMLAQLWGIEKVALVYGWSMGAMQAYHWAALFPQAVERIAIVCGAARCAPHNHVFIEGVKHALMADPAFRDGVFTERPVRGFRAMARVYASWALSQTFFREELWRTVGATSLEDYLVTFWEANYARRDPSDLLAQFWTWQHGDISANALYAGDFPKALASIRAKTLLMPGDQDLYFQVEDNRLEMQHLKHAELQPIPSAWGHRAGNPLNQPEDRAFIETRVRALLAA
jgi:homoserine O-acetyltransferase